MIFHTFQKKRHDQPLPTNWFHLIGHMSLLIGITFLITNCATTHKGNYPFNEHHPEITLVKCPPPLKPLKNKVLKKRPIKCFIFTPPVTTTSTDHHPRPRMGVWIGSARKHTSPAPLLLMPNEIAASAHFTSEYEIQFLTKIIETLSWNGVIIAFGSQLMPPQKPLPASLHPALKKSLLSCKNTLATTTATSNPDPLTRGAYYQTFFKDCLTELKTTANFNPSHYNSQTLAHDTATFIKKMNYKKIHLVATSYSTRAALQVLQLAPSHIDRALFEDIYPLGYHPLDDLPWTLQSLFERLDKACLTHPSCKKKFKPSLTAVLEEILVALTKNPITPKFATTSQGIATSTTNQQPSPTATQKTLSNYYLDAHGYLNYILNQLHQSSSSIHLPALLELARKGTYFSPHHSIPIPPPAYTKNPTKALQHAFFQQLWLCGDRNALAPSLTEAALNRKLSETKIALSAPLKAIVLAEWNTSPCNVVVDFNKNKKPHQSAQTQTTQTLSSHPILILSGALNPRFAPELSEHPSLDLKAVLHLTANYPTQRVLFTNSCFQQIAKTFLTTKNLQQKSLTHLKKAFPCATTEKRKPFPFELTG
ncbi:hypothetical protein COTS27_00170 [Spirochaetota bacterium]|nr:hypothetical protein COTS27_00170 [Spirochaetota bacterium]